MSCPVHTGCCKKKNPMHIDFSCGFISLITPGFPMLGIIIRLRWLSGRMNVSHRLSSLWPGFDSWLLRSISKRFSPADHTPPARPEPIWQKMAQFTLNVTAKTCGHWRERPRAERQWLKNHALADVLGFYFVDKSLPKDFFLVESCCPLNWVITRHY